jgi:peptidoglycan/LPS O-acetylase OafA/YrhL
MQPTDRLHALDAVRAFALLLGVFYHAALSFYPDARVSGLTPVQDVSPSAALSLLGYVEHMFRMPLFFLIAGLFARMMLHRKGVRGFCADRLQRIGVPLVVGWLVFFPVVNTAWSWGVSHSLHHSPLLSWPRSLARFPTSYLWFLYYLLLIYGLALAVRWLLLRTRANLARVARLIRFIVSPSWLGLITITTPVAVAMLLTQSGWSLLSGIATPNDSLIPAPLPLLGYGLAFALGWMISRDMELLTVLRRRWRGYLTAALFATLTCVVIGVSAYPEYTKPVTADDTQVIRALYAFSYVFASWCWAFVVIGLALRFLSTVSSARRYVADASYWIYLLHYPLVLILQDVLADVRWHWLVKYSIILSVTLAICFMTYQLLVRFTVIGRVLNGHRAPRSSLRPLAPATPPLAP